MSYHGKSSLTMLRFTKWHKQRDIINKSLYMEGPGPYLIAVIFISGNLRKFDEKGNVVMGNINNFFRCGSIPTL